MIASSNNWYIMNKLIRIWMRKARIKWTLISMKISQRVAFLMIMKALKTKKTVAKVIFNSQKRMIIKKVQFKKIK